jgi:drug/metabolite transporter (DMT)-like permease
MFGATAAFAGMQAFAKVARLRGFDTVEVMLYRSAPGLPFLWWSLRRRGYGLFPEEPRDVIVRSLLGALAMGTNFAALRGLTLAQFSTLGLSHPVFVALVSPRLLGERGKRHRYVAMPIALIGALVLLVPGLGSHRMPLWPSLLALVSAAFGALAQIWVRKATASDPAERVVFHFAAVVSLIGVTTGLAQGHFASLPARTSAAEFIGLIAGLAALGTIGQVLMTRAYSHGEASSVSLVLYAGILLSMLLDLVVWDVLPAPTAIVGALMMVGAGVVLVQGERGRPKNAKED